MSTNSKIEWCDATFNIVWGCSKVSPGCQNCYAIGESKRRGFDVWGTAKMGATRRVFGDAHWAEPLRWDRKAAKDGVRARVFSSSMADVCDDHPTTRAEVRKLWRLIRATPNLDWMLLTKRPENWKDVLPDDYDVARYPNVWRGCSVESQKYAELRIPRQLEIPAAVQFLSCEPLLSGVDLTALRFPDGDPRNSRNALTGQADMVAQLNDGSGEIVIRTEPLFPHVDLVIAGGESGPKARPVHPDWARSLRDQCSAAGVPFFWKQWGTWITETQAPDDILLPSESWEPRRWRHPKGERYWRVGKTAAGRELDGRTWDEMPAVRA